MPVDYHAWTHLPKSQGGTDPIQIEGADMPWARAQKTFGSTVQSISNNFNTDIVWTDYINIDPGDSGADYFTTDSPTNQDLIVSTQGMYLAKVVVLWAGTNVGKYNFGISANIAGNIDWHFADTNWQLQGELEASATELLHLEAGTALSVVVYQRAGAARDLDAAFLHVVKLSNYTGLDRDQMDPDRA